MAVVTVRNLSAETHRALKIRAAENGRSTEAEIREILEAAAHPQGRVKLGTALAKLAEPFGGLDLDVARDKSVQEPTAFE
jgi:plasmid stability protein